MASSNQKARKATGAEAPRVGPRAIYTPPSSSDALIGPLFIGWPKIGAIVLGHMDPVDRSFLAGASKSIGDAVMMSENPSDASTPLDVAGVTPGFGLGLEAFTDSLEKFRYGVLTYHELKKRRNMISVKSDTRAGWFVRWRRLKETLMYCARPGRSGVHGVTQPPRSPRCPHP